MSLSLFPQFQFQFPCFPFFFFVFFVFSALGLLRLLLLVIASNQPPCTLPLPGVWGWGWAPVPPPRPSDPAACPRAGVPLRAQVFFAALAQEFGSGLKADELELSPAGLAG